MTYPTTTYTPSKVYLYNQYKENVALQKFVDSLNSYIQAMLSEVFESLSLNLNLQRVGESSSNTYSSFYVENYFGIKKIPDPNVQNSNLTYVIFDEDGTDYDKQPEPIRYDTLLSVDEKVASVDSYLSSDVWAKLVTFMLDYRYDVYNLDSLRRLLEVFYEAFTGEALDFRTISLSQIIDLQRRRLIVKIPRDNTVWEAFRLLVLYNPSLIGLPYGSVLEVDFMEASLPNEDA